MLDVDRKVFDDVVSRCADYALGLDKSYALSGTMGKDILQAVWLRILGEGEQLGYMQGYLEATSEDENKEDEELLLKEIAAEINLRISGKPFVHPKLAEFLKERK